METTSGFSHGGNEFPEWKRGENAKNLHDGGYDAGSSNENILPLYEKSPLPVVDVKNKSSYEGIAIRSATSSELHSSSNPMVEPSETPVHNTRNEENAEVGSGKPLQVPQSEPFVIDDTVVTQGVLSARQTNLQKKPNHIGGGVQQRKSMGEFQATDSLLSLSLESWVHTPGVLTPAIRQSNGVMRQSSRSRGKTPPVNGMIQPIPEAGIPTPEQALIDKDINVPPFEIRNTARRN